MSDDVLDDPAMPVFWGKNQKGMQADEELTGNHRLAAVSAWLTARDAAVQYAKSLHRLGVHKQLVNRVLEPWSHINVVVTATEWSNFDALRRHPAAQPEMRVLADAMHAARGASVPVPLMLGWWHTPYVNADIDDEASDYAPIWEHVWARHKVGDYSEGACDQLFERRVVECSVARCARVSYLTTEGKLPSVAEDLALYDRLVGSVPLHASPAEHQATPDVEVWSHNASAYRRQHPAQHANFRGWRQYRKMLPNECA